MVNKNKDFCPALAAFIFLFVLAYVIDNSNIITMFPNFLHLDAKRYLILITVLIGAWTLLKPSSLFRSISFFVFVLLDIIVRLPRTPNHVVFEAVFILTILTSFLYLKIKNKNEFTKKSFYETFAPAVRLELIIFYFWTFFHKLNTGFLDKYISCATVQFFNIQEAIPFYPHLNGFFQLTHI